MKIKKLYTIFLIFPFVTYAQIRPFLSDVPSNFLSAGITAEYALLKNKEEQTRKELNKLITDYSQRTLYLNAAAITSSLLEGIEDEILECSDRYEKLKKDNESLYSLFSHFVKKDNRKRLSIISKMINNVKNESDSQSSLNILYGEKLNLYQNTTQTLSDINRLMDKVEDNIATNKIMYKLFN